GSRCSPMREPAGLRAGRLEIAWFQASVGVVVAIAIEVGPAAVLTVRVAQIACVAVEVGPVQGHVVPIVVALVVARDAAAAVAVIGAAHTIAAVGIAVTGYVRRGGRRRGACHKAKRHKSREGGDLRFGRKHGSSPLVLVPLALTVEMGKT